MTVANLDTCETVASAEQHANTRSGRIFGAWVRGNGRTVDQMKDQLVQAGYTKVEAATHNWERDGFHASLLRRPDGSIDISVMASDEPVVCATGENGYLPTADRPQV